MPEEVRVSEDGAIRFGGIGVSTPHKKWNINRPDVLVVDRVKKVWIIVDFSVPWDRNEKILNYSPLAKIHSVSTKIVPAVVGALGVVSGRLAGYLKDLQVPDIMGGLQTSAIIGTTIILKKVLSL